MNPTDCYQARLGNVDGVPSFPYEGSEIAPCGIDDADEDLRSIARKVYLAGPMTGYDEFNFPEFHRVTAILRAWGFDVTSPAERDEADGFDPKNHAAQSHSYYMAIDLPLVCEADAVVVLDGWEKSSGAQMETAIAKKLGKPVVAFDTLASVDAPEIVVGVPLGYVRGRLEYFDESARPTLVGLGDGEVRATHDTGAQKGRKPEAFSLIPGVALAKVARHYGVGALKYASHNWRGGYPWSWSIDALLRHAFAYSDGETTDAETGSSHMAAVAFHALSLLTFEDEHPELDDRWNPVEVEGVASAA